MAIQGNAASILNRVQDAAGKDNYGAGGDFFTPGHHIVKVTETVLGESVKIETKGQIRAVFQAQVIESEGGESSFEMVEGKAVRRGASVPVKALSVGSTRKQILMGNKPNFDVDLGNFCLAAKKTFKHMYDLCKETDVLEDFLKERWPPSIHPRIHAFIARAEASRDVTDKQDIQDIVELDLAVGLVMHVHCGEKPNKLGNVILGQISWKAGSAEDQSKGDEDGDDDE